MTQPLRFHLQVAPSSTRVRPASATVGVQTNPLARVIIAAVPGGRGAPGPPGEGVQIFGEALTGAKNGTNTVFTTADDFRANSTAVYLNGLREFHYTETGVNEVTFEDAPLSGDDIRTDYIIQ